MREIEKDRKEENRKMENKEILEMGVQGEEPFKP